MSCSRTQRSDAAEVGKFGIIAYAYSLVKCTSTAIQEGEVGRGLNTWSDPSSISILYVTLLFLDLEKKHYISI